MSALSTQNALTRKEFDELWKVFNAHYEDGNERAVMEVCEQILARAPSLVPTQDELEEWRDLFFVRGLYGHLLVENERFSDAMAVARKAAPHPHFHRLAHTMIGRCYAGLGENELAVEEYLRALEPEPLKDTIPWIYLSFALERCGRQEESDFCLYTALQIEPDHADGHFNLGVSARLRGELEEAEWRFRLALNDLPDYGSAHAELGRLLLEQAEDDEERLSEADQHLRGAVELEPDHVRHRLYLAQLHWALGQLDDADKQYQAALDIRPDWTTTHYLYAHFLECAMEDNRSAERHYLKALELDPLNLAALFSVHHFLKEQRRFGGANKFRRRVQDIGEDMARAYLGPGDTKS